MQAISSLPHSQDLVTYPFPESDKSSPWPHPTFWRSVLISSHLRPNLPSGLFHPGFPTKTLYTPLLASLRATCPAHFILLESSPVAGLMSSYHIQGVPGGIPPGTPCIPSLYFFPMAQQRIAGQGLITKVHDHTQIHTHAVGLLCTSEQPVA